MTDKPTFYEFFAGGGMARAGLGSDWQCAFSNDFDFKKGLTYQANWTKPHGIVGGQQRGRLAVKAQQVSHHAQKAR